MNRFIFVVVILLSVCTRSYSYDFEVNGIYYGYNTSTSTAYVTFGGKYYGNVDIPTSVTYNGRTLNVTEIGSYAFANCEDLVSVNIPNSIKSIGGSAFLDCHSLTTVNIPEIITAIPPACFKNCSSLSSILLSEKTEVIGSNAFEGCVKLESIVIPKHVIEIREEAFKTCISLKVIRIPSSVDKLYRCAFQDCTGLKTIVLEDCERGLTCDAGIFYNKYDAFWGTSPQYLYIGRNIPELLFYGNGGFDGINYDNISTIGIGQYVTGVYITNVNLWDSLKTLYCLSNNPPAVSFGTKTYANAKLYVPTGTKERYLAANGWNNFFQIEELDIDKMWHGEGEPNAENDDKQKCEKPTISYKNGKLTFNCDTEGAVCHYSITDDDIKAESSNEVQLGVTYHISVYATKEGFENSETATATLCWIDVEPKTEGITEGMLQMAARAIMVKAEGGQLSIEGAEDNSNITVYSIDGIQVGTTTSRNGVASIMTSIPKDSVAIVKIGNKSVKVMMK